MACWLLFSAFKAVSSAAAGCSPTMREGFLCRLLMFFFEVAPNGTKEDYSLLR
jgi:hypothetical protein